MLARASKFFNLRNTFVRLHASWLLMAVLKMQLRRLREIRQITDEKKKQYRKNFDLKTR